MAELTATVSLGMTKQIRQFEPFSPHVSIQGITKETTPEQVQEFCETAIKDALKTMSAYLVKEVAAEVAKLREGA